MPGQTIAIGSDHGGVAMKDALAAELTAMGYAVLDKGTHGDASVDYPDFGYAVATVVAGGEAEKGILICGSGIGISIAANRHPGIRCALCTDGLMARLSREHNDANVLALGARIIGIETARDCVQNFLNTPFAGGRHAGRVKKLSEPHFEEMDA